MLAGIIAVLAVILDQVTKFIVVENIGLGGEVPFIPGFMTFKYVRNTGAAFSMLEDSPWVFMVLSVVSMALIVYILKKEYHRHVLMNISLAMILGGGLGNMVDRVRLKYVVDFFRFDFVDFAIFNVADIFVTCGAVLLLVYMIFFDSKVEARIKAENAQKQEKTEEPAVLEEKIPETQVQPQENENNNG